MEIKDNLNSELQGNFSEDLIICKYCKSEGLDQSLSYCPNCGYPIKGADEQIKSFMVNKQRQKMELEKGEKAVKTARIMLYVLSGLNFIIGLVFFAYFQTELIILLAGLFGALIYFGLAVWCRTNPFPAILSGFFVYLIFIALNAIGDPGTIYKGILIKILIILGFIYGLKGAKDSERIKKEFKSEKSVIKFES